MKVSFSLNKAKASTSAAPAPSLKQPAAFASFDDDEPLDAAPTASSSSSRAGAGQGAARTDVNKKLSAQASGHVSKALRKRLEEERRVDETVFEYDEVWEKMQEAKQRQKEKKEVESLQKKPKYIGALLQAASTRKLDHLRAEEKMIQREREQEGDEFADKDQFVTQAYRDQMAEVRRAEAEEKKRDEEEKAKRKSSTGLSYFYKQLLDQSEKEHTATVEATQKASNGKKVIGPASGPSAQNLTITKPADVTPLSDLEMAQAAEAEGKHVELNDDNQIVDKRDLLSAGLNLSAPNTRRLGLGSAASRRKGEGDGADEVRTHTAVGSAASLKEINERRRREIARQLAEENERTKEEQERRERERMERTVAKRNTEEDVKSARERYLERKRRRLEEPVSNPNQDGVGVA